ncbi:MAG: hypothetical protein HDQ88_12380 [Clostridia bacterium]|nr:hypothetical protein [Clostridia bacterium]
MIRKGFAVNYLPLKTYTSMDVGTGTEPVQDYDATTDVYYPDRALSPLVLTPVVGYSDPNDGTEVPNAAASLTDGHWYRLDNSTSGQLDSTTEIKSGTTYVIDTLVGSATYGRISIGENVKPNNPVTYVFRATLTHPNGERKLVEMRHQARSNAVATIPTLSIDNATEVMYNPWGSEDVIAFNPILRPDISGTTYLWESLHGTTWGEVESTLLDWAVSKSGNGVKVKQSVMQDRIDLRCTASIPVAGGGNLKETVAVSIVRRLPKYTPKLYGVVNVTPDVKSISPRAQIEVDGIVRTDLKGELDIVWYNAAGAVVGRGLNPVIPLSALGGVYDIGFDDVDQGGWKALTDDQGRFILSDGKLILVKKPN